MPKLQPALPETRFSLGGPEKNAKADPRVDAGFRARSASNPKPVLQSPKPSLAARPAIPQKPRTASRAGKALLVVGWHRPGGAFPRMCGLGGPVGGRETAQRPGE